MTAEEGIAWATVGLAVVTAVLALATFLSVREGKNSRAQWTAMSIEATRARLDAKAPAVDLRIVGFEDTRRLVEPPDGQWIFSRDQDQHLAVRCEFAVTNRSPVSVWVEVDGTRLLQPVAIDTPETDLHDREPVMAIMYRPTTELARMLSPEATWSVRLEAVRPLSAWAQEWRLLQATEDVTTAGYAVVNVFSDDDNGTTDTWVIDLHGSPIEPVEGNDAAWRLRAPGDSKAAFLSESVPVRRRTYFLSRTEGVRLPHPPQLEAFLERKAKEFDAEFPETGNDVQSTLNLAGTVVRTVMIGATPVGAAMVDVFADVLAVFVGRPRRARKR